MARGPKKHLKRLAAPNHWMLDKLTGVFAPRPSQGPHKLRECLPLIILLRNRLKYALNRSEVTAITMGRMVKVDHKVRTDACFPAGFQDVITLDKTGENFRLLYDPKGRFVVHRITPEEAQIKKGGVGAKGVPFIVAHDSRTIRYPSPDVKVNDTIKYNIKTGETLDHFSFEVGNICMITSGNNLGRIGVITKLEKHPGSFDIVHVKDAVGHDFATRKANVFVIGKSTKAAISLPKGKGIRRTILEEREIRASA